MRIFSFLSLLFLCYGLLAQSNVVVKGKLKANTPEGHQVIAYYPSYDLNTRNRMVVEVAADGSFEISPDKLPGKLLVELFVDDVMAGTIVVDKGLQLTLHWDSPKEGEVNIAAFGGPDSAVAQGVYGYYNARKVSRKWLMHNTWLQDKEQEYDDRIARLEKVYKKEFARQEKAFAKYSDEVVALLREEWKTMHYYDQLMASVLEGLPEDRLRKIALFRPQHSSTSTLRLDQLLFYFLGKASPAQYIANVRNVNAAEKDKAGLDQFIAELQKRYNGEDFDGDVYMSGYMKFISARGAGLYSLKIKRIVDTLRVLSVWAPDRLLLSGYPTGIQQRTIHYTTTYGLLTEQWARAMYGNRREEDMKAQLRMNVMQQQASDPSVLGENIASSELQQLYVAKHDSLDLLLDAIKQEYKGKVVIIDFWATWCGPCISDMKRSGPNKKELQRNGVEVVYFCEGVTSERSIWKERVIQLNVNGKHFHLSPELTGEFRERFDLNYYPSTVVIDAAGGYHAKEVSKVSTAKASEVAAKYGKK